MTNYTAIRNMSPEQLEDFLDQVYLTGLNTGMYAAWHEEDEEILDINPFDGAWLSASAEKATEAIDDDEGYMLDALVAAIFRSAGITPEDAVDKLEECKTEE